MEAIEYEARIRRLQERVRELSNSQSQAYGIIQRLGRQNTEIRLENAQLHRLVESLTVLTEEP
eukprot:7147931-Prorocentrum_lima.AAC.1